MKKIGLIVIALVLVMGAMGVGYAYWTQTITVNASVQTGYVQASFINAQPTATFVDTGDTGGVAWFTDSISGTVTSGDTLNITLSNAYPGMTAVIPITIKNTGSIPIGNIAGVANPSDFYMPAGSTAVLTGTQLPDGLAVGDWTTDAIITVFVPYGLSSSDPAFNQYDQSSYHFKMTITSTQFSPGYQYTTGGSTGVVAGTTYGPP